MIGSSPAYLAPALPSARIWYVHALSFMLIAGQRRRRGTARARCPLS